MPFPAIAAHFTPTKRTDIYPAISPAHALTNTAAGLRVFITGAGRGIGRAQAIAFAQAGAARVTIAARSENELHDVAQAIKEATGGKTEVVTVVVDVTNEDDVKRAFEAAGEVHVLVNNAGKLETVKKIHESDVAEWWSTYEVNVRGTYIPTRQALQNAIKKAGPAATSINLTIINTSSIGAMATSPRFSSNESGKSAVNRLTEYIHFEYEHLGVRAFAFHPGGVLTSLALQSMPPEMHHFLADTPELGAGFALWVATQGTAVDFLRGRYSSATWDVVELKALKDTIREKNLLWTRIVGQEQVFQT